MIEDVITHEAEAVITGHPVLDILFKHKAISTPEIAVGGNGIQVKDEGDVIVIKRNEGNIKESITIHSREEPVQEQYMFALTRRAIEITNPDGTINVQGVDVQISETSYGKSIPPSTHKIDLRNMRDDPNRPFGQAELGRTDITLDFSPEGQPQRVMVATYGDKGIYTAGGVMTWDSNRNMEFDGGGSNPNVSEFTIEQFNQELRKAMCMEQLDVQKGFKLNASKTQENIMDFTQKDTPLGQRIVLIPNI